MTVPIIYPYYLIIYRDGPSIWRPRGSPHVDEVNLVVIINANTGQLKEVSWVPQPVSYLTMTPPTAIQLITDHLIDLGYSDIDPKTFTTTYIYQELSPFYPDVQVETPYGVFIVSQEGSISNS